MSLPSNQVKDIAEAIFGPIEWKNHEGQMDCPGAAMHSQPGTACRVFADTGSGLPPTVFCFHASCISKVEAANRMLRAACWKAERGGQKIERRRRTKEE